MNQPTEAELAILKVLWKQGPSSVRSVNDILSSEKEVGYTTTLKIMQIMYEKGILDRDTSKRSHIYIPLLAEQDVKSSLLKKFMNSAFEGSASAMIMQALGNESMTEDELDQIKTLIDQLENKK